jgi:hypothetical protein
MGKLDIQFTMISWKSHMKTEIIRINLKEHVDERVAWVGEEALRLAMALCITATTYAGEHLGTRQQRCTYAQRWKKKAINKR